MDQVYQSYLREEREDLEDQAQPVTATACPSKSDEPLECDPFTLEWQPSNPHEVEEMHVEAAQ